MNDSIDINVAIGMCLDVLSDLDDESAQVAVRVLMVRYRLADARVSSAMLRADSAPQPAAEPAPAPERDPAASEGAQLSDAMPKTASAVPARVIDVLREHDDGLAPRLIAQFTQLPPATVSWWLKRLLDAGLVRRTGQKLTDVRYHAVTQ